jgi:hypothetical protein
MLCEEIQNGTPVAECFECGGDVKITRVLIGKRRFCKNCGRRAAMKYVMRDRRARQRKER